jgi:pimeloyl-ACP methyl ester carboxylesterase
MKLFWSMRPPKGVEGVPLVPPLSPTDVRITAEIDGRTVASTRFTRTAKAADVTAEAATLSREGFVGTYYHLPPGPPVPAVLQIGGSFGGHSPLPAALVASRGYPTLSLAYFNEPGLPTALKDIPLEYFERALRWLATQPGVDPRRLIVAGASRGGEAALLLGTVYTDLVHGVVACTSSAYVLGGLPGSRQCVDLSRAAPATRAGRVPLAAPLYPRRTSSREKTRRRDLAAVGWKHGLAPRRDPRREPSADDFIRQARDILIGSRRGSRSAVSDHGSRALAEPTREFRSVDLSEVAVP